MTYGDFPQQIQDKIKERVREQGNVYNKDCYSTFGKTDGGFTWEDSIEGDSFWRKILKNKEFDIFYKLYPKKDKLELISTEPRTYIASCKDKKYKITIEEYED